MKKLIFRFVLIVVAVMLLSSCLSMSLKTFKLVIDKDVPAERTATVTFTYGNFTVKEWNDIDIFNDIYKKRPRFDDEKVILTVPAGDTSFTFDIYYTFSGGNSSVITYPVKNVKIVYSLESGKKYLIGSRRQSQGSGKPYDLIVGIYDVTAKRSKGLKEWTLGSTK
jgi:hypothetical protein